MKLPLERLWQHTFDPRALEREHTLRPLPLRKRVVVESLGAPASPAVPLVASRWTAGALPDRVPVSTTVSIEVVPGWFAYRPALGARAMEWHLNFASASAFSTYATTLLAQDEMQVLEHPILMSVHEALCASGNRPDTVGPSGEATPVLVRSVERRMALDTSPNARDGRPEGIYGNAFGRTDPDAIVRAVRRLEPPTLSHILAIEAPSYGEGAYRPDEIAEILRTAWLGFSAAAEDSRAAGATAVTIHSGYWGCGAYGGDRVLMTLLQAIAARAAGIHRLVLHAGDDDIGAREGVALAAEFLEDATDGTIAVETVVMRILDRGFTWGESDGN